MFTVRDLLQIGNFKTLTVRTKSSTSLENIVTYSVMTEVPDVELFVKKGVFIVTTAMVFKDNPLALITYLDSIKAAGAAVLGIKKGRFLQMIPREVINHADKINLPLLEISEDQVLITLVEDIQKIIEGKDDFALAMLTQQELSDLLFREVTIQGMIDRIAKITHTSVFLVNPYASIIAKKLYKTNVNINFSQIKKIIKNRKITKDIITTMTIDGKDEKIHIVPIKVYTRYSHYLIFCQPEKMPYPVSAFTIKQASLILAFAIYRDLKLKEKHLEMVKEYFRLLIDKEKENLSEKILINSDIGFVDSDYYLVIKVSEPSLHGLHHQTISYKETVKLMVDWLHSFLDHYFNHALLIYFDITREIFILLQQPSDLTKQLKEIHCDFKDDLNLEIIFSLGNRYANLSDVKYSYLQANQVYERMIQQEKYDVINVVQDENLEELLEDIETQAMKEFCLKVLKDFAYPSDSKNKELRLTLEVYLKHLGEIQATANEIYVHRNTVNNRIKKIEAVLEHDVLDPKYVLNLLLALKLSNQHT